jgi:hypothetical protein
LVAAAAGDAGIGPSGEAPLPATKRSRAAAASGRAKATKGTRTKAPKTANAGATDTNTIEAKVAEAAAEPEVPVGVYLLCGIPPVFHSDRDFLVAVVRYWFAGFWVNYGIAFSIYLI